MIMNSLSFTVYLTVTLLIQFAIADSNNLKLAETPKNHASPQLYIFGGLGGTELNYAVQSAAFHFNSTTGEWKSAAGMKMKRVWFCGATVGTKIYLFGGENSTEHASTDTAEVYDSETGTYSPFSSMPSPLTGCGAAVLGDFIYVAGGSDGHQEFSNVIRYNIHTTNRENVSSMGNKRAGHQLVELNNRLYAIGGYRTKTFEAYNATTDRWTSLASANYKHEHFSAVVHEGKIYVCSHIGFEVYSPETDKWETLTPPRNYRGRTMVSMNGELWAFGSWLIVDPGSEFVYIYNTTTKKWSEKANMNISRKYFAAFVINH